MLATCIRVWVGSVTWVPQAQAQLPDSAQQRNRLLTEAVRTNELLAELIKTLKTHTLKVVLEGSDKNKDGLPVLPAGRK